VEISCIILQIAAPFVNYLFTTYREGSSLIMSGNTVSINSEGLTILRSYFLSILNRAKSFLSPVIRYSALHAIADARTGISFSAMIPVLHRGA